MRKTPIYQLEGDLGKWMEKHRAVIYDNVLDSAEAAVAGEYSLTAMPVLILQTDHGTTLFTIKSMEAMDESLEKALKYFVEAEEYEKAARIRDVKIEVDKTRQSFE